MALKERSEYLDRIYHHHPDLNPTGIELIRFAQFFLHLRSPQDGWQGGEDARGMYTWHNTRFLANDRVVHQRLSIDMPHVAATRKLVYTGIPFFGLPKHIFRAEDSDHGPYTLKVMTRVAPNRVGNRDSLVTTHSVTWMDHSTYHPRRYGASVALTESLSGDTRVSSMDFTIPVHGSFSRVNQGTMIFIRDDMSVFPVGLFSTNHGKVDVLEQRSKSILGIDPLQPWKLLDTSIRKRFNGWWETTGIPDHPVLQAVGLGS